MIRHTTAYRQSGIWSEHGFSLVELLVVLALIGLMGGFVASVYLFGERAVTEWERSLRLQNELHNLAEGISEDIYRSEILEEIETGHLTLSLPDDDSSRTYKMEEASLVRNGRILSNTDIELIDLVLEWNGIKSSAGKELTENITMIKLKLTITDRRDTLETTRAISLRKPVTWKQIGKE